VLPSYSSTALCAIPQASTLFCCTKTNQSKFSSIHQSNSKKSEIPRGETTKTKTKTNKQKRRNKDKHGFDLRERERVHNKESIKCLIGNPIH